MASPQVPHVSPQRALPGSSPVLSLHQQHPLGVVLPDHPRSGAPKPTISSVALAFSRVLPVSCDLATPPTPRCILAAKKLAWHKVRVQLCLLSESRAEASVRDVHGSHQPNPDCSVVPTCPALAHSSPARLGVRPWGRQSVLACPAWLVGQRAPWGPDRGCGAWRGIEAAAGDAASKRLGLCWVGMAKGGETSLGGGDGGETTLHFSGRKVLSLPGVKSSLRPRRGHPRQPRDGTRQLAAPRPPDPLFGLVRSQVQG